MRMRTLQEVVLQMLHPYCAGSLNPYTDLFENGLNSFNAVNVLVDLERHYGITFDDEELDLSTIRTVSNLTAFVQRKLEGC